MSEERDNANHTPSPTRIQRALDHGMVPYSPALSAAFQLVCFLTASLALVGMIGRGLTEWTRSQWSPKTNVMQFDATDLANGSGTLAVAFLGILASIWLASMLGHFFQKGFAVPRTQLFDVNRLMPFGKRQQRTRIELIWTMISKTIQLVMAGGAGYWYVQSHGSQFLGLWQAEGQAWVELLMQVGFGMALTVSVVLLSFSIPDYLFQHWAHRQRLMMTDEELREENRTEEGNPQLRTALRRRHRRLSA